VIVIRVIDGRFARHEDPVHGEKQDYDAEQLGVFTPKAVPVEELGVGEVGFLVANVKKSATRKIGDTITERRRRPSSRFPASRN
jgi:GTP-binding protein LepA